MCLIDRKLSISHIQIKVKFSKIPNKNTVALTSAVKNNVNDTMYLTLKISHTNIIEDIGVECGDVHCNFLNHKCLEEEAEKEKRKEGSVYRCSSTANHTDRTFT